MGRSLQRQARLSVQVTRTVPNLKDAHFITDDSVGSKVWVGCKNDFVGAWQFPRSCTQGKQCKRGQTINDAVCYAESCGFVLWPDVLNKCFKVVCC